MYDVTSIQNLKKDVLYLVAKASFEGTLEEERDLIPEKMIEGPEPTCCNKQLSELSWKRLYQSMSFWSDRTRTYKIKNRFSEM